MQNQPAWVQASPDWIHCVLIASRSGLNVIFQRFYLPGGKAASDSLQVKWMEALHRACASDVPTATEGTPFVARFEGNQIVWMVVGGLVLFMAGSGVYNEIALAEALTSLSGVLKLVFKSSLATESLAVVNIGKICLAVDQMIFAGQLDRLDVDGIYKSIKLKTNVK